MISHGYENVIIGQLKEYHKDTRVELFLWNGPCYLTSSNRVKFEGSTEVAIFLLEGVYQLFEDCAFKPIPQ